MSFSIAITEDQSNNTTKYGLVIRNNDCEFRFPDITESKDSIEALINRLSEDISPEHYNDIVRDFVLGEAYDKLININLV